MNRMLVFAIAALLGISSVGLADATAGTVNVKLGDSGWLVSGPSYYQLNINLAAEGVDRDGVKWVALDISKTFFFDADPVTGIFPAIELNFIQDSSVAFDDVATRIYIQSEGVVNATGSIWEDYHWVLLQHGIASYNRELTDPSGDITDPGWYYGPFTDHAWLENDDLNTEALVVWGGVVPVGGSFFPGTGDGNLVIDIDNEQTLPGLATFQFMQYIQNPPAPEPATLGILFAGGLIMLRRRRA